ncbi:MAG: LamG domain-containing protein, partial [Candidatus Altiarchaeota archaeon]|nr:LamG domain-containing protein [Candidatus Altiarchaeota archaeon]
MNPSKTQVRNLVLILLLALVLTLSASAPENWYNPDSTAADVNHGIDYVQSLASTNSEDFYTNTSGICIVGAIGENTSRVLYQWYRNNQSLYEYTYGNSTENEVLYLNFDEGEGNIAYDKSGKGNDGILNDSNPSNSDGTTLPQWVTGRYGKALNFDGLDDKVKCTISGATGFSSAATSLWIKTTDSDTTQHIANVIYTNVIYLNRFVAGKFIGIWDGSSGNNDATQVSITTINDGTWHHIASSNDGSTTKIYVDGVEENSYSETFAIPSSTACSIGSNIEPSLSSPGHFLNGTIDEVLIYDRVLSNSEIRNQYLSGPHGLPYYEFSKHDEVFCSAIGDGSPSESTKTNSLVAYWNFDGFAEGDSGTAAVRDNGAFATDITKVNNGTFLGDTVLLMHFEDTNGNLGATVTDESGYGNHGTLGNSSKNGTNPHYTTGISGTGLVFNNETNKNDQSVVVMDDESLHLTELTLSYWIKPTSNSHSDNLNPIRRHPNNYECEYGSSLGLACYVYDGAWKYVAATMTLNEWNYIAFTASSSSGTAKIYKNGVLIDSRDDIGTVNSTGDGSLIIGAQTGSQTINGSMDEVAIYS